MGLVIPGLSSCRKIRERQAIRKYAREASRANQKRQKLHALEAHLLPLQRARNASRMRTFFKERYLPAVRAYVEAVRKVPAQTDRLRAIHGQYLRAWERSLEAHETYADQLTANNFAASWKRVLGARVELAAAEARYRREIGTYYRENDVRLSEQ